MVEHLISESGIPPPVTSACTQDSVQLQCKPQSCNKSADVNTHDDHGGTV